MRTSQFKDLTATLMPLLRDDVDTDQIIPARYLTATDKRGFGRRLFMDLRFEEDGKTPKPDFVMNQKKYRGAKILLGHENFGCGSSREHAPWALLGAGFRAVIAISFADIFRNNSAKNGLLLIELPKKTVDMLHADVVKSPKEKAKINLRHQTCTWKKVPIKFPINQFVKKCLMEGLDDIGYTLSFAKYVSAYEKRVAGKNI
jgi:3-isopropylmalate/(R)-2-methylmalate dehydratase small subunit